MPKSTNLCGKRFGRLLVLSVTRSSRNQKAYNCLCDCGQTRVLETTKLTRKHGNISCGCGKMRNDLTGRVFDHLTVLKRVNKPNGNESPLWLCKCSCGKELEITTYNLTYKRKTERSCGCVDFAISYKKFIKRLYSHHIVQARIRKLENKLSFEDWLKLITKNCFYCDSPPANVARSRTSHDYKYVYGGIDRLDSSKGYTHSNTVSCCKRCNIAKHTATFDEFLDLVSKIYKNFNKTVTAYSGI